MLQGDVRNAWGGIAATGYTRANGDIIAESNITLGVVELLGGKPSILKEIISLYELSFHLLTHMLRPPS
jgi:hypothetical protein